MKNLIVLIYAFCISITGNTQNEQDFLLTIDGEKAIPSKNWDDLKKFNDIKTVSIKTKENDGKIYYIKVNDGEDVLRFTGDMKDNMFREFQKWRGKELSICGENKEIIVIGDRRFTFKLPIVESKNESSAKVIKRRDVGQTAIGNWLTKWSACVKPTNRGLVVMQKGCVNEGFEYVGDDYVHIFLDQYGQLLVSSIPNGIPNMRYVVHILYPIRDSMPTPGYFITQTKGSYQEDLTIYGELNLLSNNGQKALNQSITDWREEVLMLRPSNTDIEFDVITRQEDGKSVKLNTLTIPMTKTYNVALNVGLFTTNLSNPTFSLLPSATDPTSNIVKRDKDGRRSTITGMVTFYTSPIILLKRLLTNKETVPDYRLTGRNFLLDNNPFERIYPSVGLSINEKSVENIFLGLNWEFARGGSLFAGWHYGRVNTFEEGNNFKYNETAVNKNDFDLRLKQSWGSGFAFGINLDFKILKNFVGQAAQ